jgi:phosphatidylglycerol:prolipoprotein diacylglycerol transferase
MTVYLIGYGIWRFLIEFVRGDIEERGKFIPGLTPSQFWAILMVIGGIAFFFIYRYFDKKIESKKLANNEQ